MLDVDCLSDFHMVFNPGPKTSLFLHIRNYLNTLSDVGISV